MLVYWNQLTDWNIYRNQITFLKYDFPSKLFKYRDFMSSKTTKVNCFEIVV